MKLYKISKLLFTLTILNTTAPVNAALNYSVSFDDPSATYSEFYSDIRSNVLAAGAAWDTFIVGNADLEVQISFSSSVATANGASLTSSFVSDQVSYEVWEQGAAGEINTGIDPNGSTPDIGFTIGTDYLINELWFDSDPFSRTSTIANGRTDAVSVFLHEFGHAFAFNGWRDPNDGSIDDVHSTFDENVIFNGTDLLFTGANAMNVAGEGIALTLGNYGHLGNDTGLGVDLISDLMNGVVFDRETRYDISALDLAILADSGLTVVPVPAAFWLFSTGLIGLVSLNRRKDTL